MKSKSRLEKCFYWGIDPEVKKKVKKLFLKIHEKYYGEPLADYLKEIEKL